MNNLKKEYKKGDLTVTWEPGKCMHSEKCWRGLVEVFNPKKKPWIDVEGASKERIKEQIDQCPSGALGYHRAGEHRAVEAQNKTKVIVSKNGPYLIEAPLEIVDHEGRSKVEERTVALCRCGYSGNKPYCDGSHKKQNFEG